MMPMDIPPAPVPMNAECVVVAAAYYHLPPEALIVIRMMEGGKSGTVMGNTNGSYDYGHNQINTVNLVKFERFGISKADITRNECVNVAAAAYLLREATDRRGGDIWEGIGDYHSRTPRYHNEYLSRAKRKYNTLLSKYGRYVNYVRDRTNALLGSWYANSISTHNEKPHVAAQARSHPAPQIPYRRAARGIEEARAEPVMLTSGQSINYQFQAVQSYTSK